MFTHTKHRDSIANQMMALEAYELEHGIQKGDGSELPVALVTMKEQTDYITGSDLERTVNALLKAKLHTVCDMNIMELLELPRPMLMMIIKQAEIASKSDAPLLAEMEKLAKENGNKRAAKTMGFNYPY